MKSWLQNSPVSVGVLLAAIGFVLIFLAWNGAAGVDHIQGQLPYVISGGLTGLGLIGAGLTTILVQASRRDSRELSERMEELTEAIRDLNPNAQRTARAVREPAPAKTSKRRPARKRTTRKARR